MLIFKMLLLLLTVRQTHLILLDFVNTSFLFFFFNKLKVYSNSASSKSVTDIFPMGFAQFVSLSHYGNSCNISNFFIVIFTFVMVMCDQ